MKKKNTVLLVLFTLGIFLAGCTAAEARTPAGPEVVTLKLKWKHQFQFAGYYMAREKGFYEDAGLQVIIEDAESSQESIDEVVEGKADFGIGSSDLLIAYTEGTPIVVLASLYQHSPLILIADRASGIDTVHDLVGKRVMLEPHADELIAYLSDEGISKDDLILYPHTFDIQPLVEGEIDAMSAYLTDEVFLVEQEGLDTITFSPRMGGIDFYSDTLFTSQEFAYAHPLTVQAFLEASQQGWEYAFENVEETADIILSEYSDRHSREHLLYEAEAMRKLVLPDIVEIGYMNEGRWVHIGDTYAGLGMVPENYSLDGFLFTPIDESIANPYKVILVGFVITAAVISLILLAHGFTKLFSSVNQRWPGISSVFKPNQE